MDISVTPERVKALTIAPASAWIHSDVGCVGCHPQAEEIPHPKGMGGANPCLQCHDDVVKTLNASAHGDSSGGTSFNAECWNCHPPHQTVALDSPDSPVGPRHVASQCLTCHDQRSYLSGVHGFGVEKAGLEFAATCVSCHGAHDIQAHGERDSRVARRNISFTCGKCHAPVAETYRKSVHGAALTQDDNPDVPTCVDCHEPHATADPRSPEFRLASPRLCARCHANPAIMDKYGLSTEVFDTYVADFHGTTAELFRAVTPDQPMNKAVCYDCHGFHDVQSVRKVGEAVVAERLLVRCQVCHPTATTKFLSAWTGHYVPSPERYPIIYYVKLFYQLVIPATVGFFLLYIGIDAVAQRRQRRERRSR